MKRQFIMQKRNYRSIKINMFLGLTREIMAFLFPLVTNLYVIRVLGKENYGRVQFVRSNVSYFSLLAGLGIYTYAVREGARVRDDRAKFEKFTSEIFTTQTISAGLALTILSSVLLFFYFNNMEVDYSLYFIFCLPIVMTVLGRDWINTVYEDYLFTTIRYISVSLIVLVSIFILVNDKEDYTLYAFLSVLSACSYCAINLFRVRRYTKFRLSNISSTKKHIKSILVLFSSSIASTVYLNSDVSLLGAMVGNEAVAIYSVASHVYGAVKQISNTVIGVTVPRMSYYVGIGNENSSELLINKLCDCVMIIILPSIVGSIELGKQAMFFMGGEEYIEGVYALYILSIALFFAVFADLFVRCVLIPHQQDKYFMYATITSATVNIVLNFFFVPRFSYIGASITTLLSEITIMCIVLHKAKEFQKIKINIRSIGMAIIGCIPIVIICEISKRVFTNVVVIMLFAVCCSVTAYTLLLCLLGYPMMLEVVHKGRRKFSVVIHKVLH